MCQYRTYPIRLFPTQEGEAQLLELSLISSETYNHFLYMSQDRYEKTEKIYGNYEMHKLYTGLRNSSHKHWQKLNTKAAQAILNSLFSSYRSFFALRKKDSKAQPPGFKLLDRFNTILLNQSGWIFKENNIVSLSKIEVPYASDFSNEELQNMKIKEMRILKMDDLNGYKWILQIVTEIPDGPVPEELTIKNNVLVADLGISELAVAVDSKGQVITLPNKAKKIDKYFSKRIKKAKDKLKKCQPESKKFKRLSLVIKRIYRKKNRQKRQVLHTQVNKLLKANHHTIVLGDLQVKKLHDDENNKKKGVSKGFHQSNIATFMFILTYKALEKGVNVVKVNEANTTQLNCLTRKKFPEKVELSQREVELKPGLVIKRDLNSAINLYLRWYSHHLAALTPPLDVFGVLERNNLVPKGAKV